MIRETVVTTLSAEGRPHIAPLGLIEEGERWIAAPFAPSTTMDNLRAVPQLVASHTDDVRVIAGCLTGRRDWPLESCAHVIVPRLSAALTHEEMVVESVRADPVRPRFVCRVVHHATHAPFAGFNRAQAAVIEAAILVSRLHMLEPDKVRREMAYLRIAVDKTAGERERTAWDWLSAWVDAFYAASRATAAAGAQEASQGGGAA